jgi:hypothetical protein
MKSNEKRAIRVRRAARKHMREMKWRYLLQAKAVKRYLAKTGKRSFGVVK